MSFHQRFTDLKEKLLKGRTPVRPIFLISYGPMGSGKSSRVNELIESQGMDPDQFVPLLLDTVIESDPEYQAECERVVREVTDVQERSQTLQEVYFRYRKDSAVLSEALLSLCVRSRLNTIFESTGSDSSLRWALYMLRRMGEVGYETWIFYPYVLDKHLKERCDARARSTHRWIPHDVVEDCSRMAQSNFPILAGHADRVWVVDNNCSREAPYTTIYRAVNTDSIDHGIDQSRCFARSDKSNRLEMQPPMLRFLKSMRRVADHEKGNHPSSPAPVVRLSVSEDVPPAIPGAAMVPSRSPPLAPAAQGRNAGEGAAATVAPAAAPTTAVARLHAPKNSSPLASAGSAPSISGSTVPSVPTRSASSSGVTGEALGDRTAQLKRPVRRLTHVDQGRNGAAGACDSAEDLECINVLDPRWDERVASAKDGDAIGTDVGTVEKQR